MDGEHTPYAASRWNELGMIEETRRRRSQRRPLVLLGPGGPYRRWVEAAPAEPADSGGPGLIGGLMYAASGGLVGLIVGGLVF